MRSLKGILVVGLIAFLLPATGYGETYNFHFGKPKKKPSIKKKKETPVATEKAVVEEEGEGEVEETATEIVPAAPGAAAPIIINNSTQSHMGSTPAEIETVVVAPPSSVGNTKIGLSAVVYPTKTIGPSIFDFDYQTGSTHSGATLGGMFSLGFATSPLFTAMFYFGAHHSKSASKTLYQFGGDLEIYPFNNSNSTVPNSIELAGLVGLNTHFFGDGKFVSPLAGGRINLNISSGFALTTVGRIGFDSLMFEGGIMTRL